MNPVVNVRVGHLDRRQDACPYHGSDHDKGRLRVTTANPAGLPEGGQTTRWQRASSSDIGCQLVWRALRKRLSEVVEEG